ncbi:hypothetical protein OsJ_12031 [Oryza sativa Japonica Group]|uniref:Uncharacterized protein n=2 Tax=Oryza TaxID=4527 RepID=B9FA74_ORYSJ|nr:hypothetical protein OsJ_12031 [Oryza sativa Japonica Group]
MVTDVAAKKLATTAADCGACRDAFLYDAGDPHCALHLQVRATLAGSGRLAAGDGGG